MAIKTIPTNYFPTGRSAPKIQYWLPVLDVEFFSPSSHRIESIPGKYRQWVKETQGVGLHESRLKFIPVTSPEVPEDYNRTVFCGFIPSYQAQPIDPLVIRGQNLPEISALPQWFPHENKWHVRFRSTEYGGISLTQGQQKKLAKWFEEQLIYATTSCLLEVVKARCLQGGRATLRDFTYNQRTYCNELDALTETDYVTG